MERSTFIKIIRLRSCWPIDKRKGDYLLPSGERLSAYIESLVTSQMDLDDLAIASDGNLYPATFEQGEGKAEYRIMIFFGENEICRWDEHEMRVRHLIAQIIR